ncbi:MAG TPA: hypothetical protein VL486_15810 [Verrucomicrobiae bacterium]|nr:hypothetical protein [Verrucomicrobiae bacterium]
MIVVYNGKYSAVLDHVDKPKVGTGRFGLRTATAMAHHSGSGG